MTFSPRASFRSRIPVRKSPRPNPRPGHQAWAQALAAVEALAAAEEVTGDVEVTVAAEATTRTWPVALLGEATTLVREATAPTAGPQEAAGVGVVLAALQITEDKAMATGVAIATAPTMLLATEERPRAATVATVPPGRATGSHRQATAKHPPRSKHGKHRPTANQEQGSPSMPSSNRRTARLRSNLPMLRSPPPWHHLPRSRKVGCQETTTAAARTITTTPPSGLSGNILVTHQHPSKPCNPPSPSRSTPASGHRQPRELNEQRRRLDLLRTSAVFCKCIGAPERAFFSV
mmetsp:Transcript_22185/g.64395  ORF Transcript_22185/g.64395 Transcript_22185/m.64395 type:complete len:291 (+) Transcript_22185:617-1489(+)